MSETGNENDFEQNLISIVAHDLKTPIAAVRGFIELLQQVGPLNVTQERYAERALGGLQRMEVLIANLLDMARMEKDLRLTLTRCDLKAIIDDALELIQGLADQRHISIELEIDEQARYITADSRWMAQVINNLLGNAVKYNRENGSIQIKVYTQPDGIRVDVRDTGLGISPDDLERIFKPFVRARSGGDRVEGTGLGLSIVDAVVRRHGGRIWVESVLKSGSTFSFTLPAQPPVDTGTAATGSGEIFDAIYDNQPEAAEKLDTTPGQDEK
jgi:signal transduction histidine kinase